MESVRGVGGASPSVPDSVPDEALLRQYAERGSEAAFAEIVRRHLGLVYATCRREAGDPELAQDAAQVVFLTLARRARSLRGGPGLAGWLFQTSRLAARNAVRDEGRRRRREQEVADMVRREWADRDADGGTWQAVEPRLNDALARLGPADREAVLLRFFEGLTLAEVGRRLGLSENTARMRVTRSVEKMRRHLAQAGAPVAIASLAVLLTDHAAQSAPASCLAAVSGSVLSVPAPPLVPLVKGVLHIMTTKAVSTAVAACVLVALVGWAVVGQKHTQALLRQPGVALWNITHRPRFTPQEAATLRTQFAYKISHPEAPTLDEDMAVVADGQRNGYLHQVMEDVRSNITQGNTYYASLGKYPDIFDAHYCDVMRQAQRDFQRYHLEQGRQIIIAQLLHGQVGPGERHASRGGGGGCSC